jgi:hypothetical protein
MFVAQATPQTLQLATVSRGASQPLPGRPSQLPNPGAQPPQLPLLHSTWAAQAMAQLPQCAGLLSGSTSQPSATTPLQSRLPGGHAQLPAVQVAPTGQTIPQPPQFWGSVSFTTSQPLDATWSQSSLPGKHVVVHA